LAEVQPLDDEYGRRLRRNLTGGVQRSMIVLSVTAPRAV
jgi:hypothetical protein